MAHAFAVLGRFRIVSAALVPAVTLLLATAGCQTGHRPSDPIPPPLEQTRSASRGRNPMPGVHSTPAFQRVRERYATKDYAGTIRLLDDLIASPSLSEADHTFLERQKAICQQGWSGTGPKTSVAASTTASTSASHPTVPTKTVASISSSDCGPRALLLVCDTLQVPASLRQLTKVAGTTKEGTTLAGLEKAAKSVGLQATGVQMDRDALKHLTQSAVAWLDGNHYVAVLAVDGDTATIHDPNDKETKQITTSDLLIRSGGILLTLSPTSVAFVPTEETRANIPKGTTPKGG